MDIIQRHFPNEIQHTLKEHFIAYAAFGLATLIMAWLPSISNKIKISYPIFLIGIGLLIHAAGVPLPWPDPFWPDLWVMSISEIVVIISLMGAGLAIGRTFDWRNWTMPLRMILITMPLCLVAIYLLGNHFLMMSVPASLLLAAVLIPTDPVLAGEVQLDDPSTENQKNKQVQFALTAEAGLNDGLAYPFTWMAVLVAQAGSWAAFDLTAWMLDEFLLRIVVGLIVGFVIGKTVGFLLEKMPEKVGVKTWDGFLALSTTFFVYGAAELVHGYGFLAVFIAGLSIRYTEKVEGDYKKKMHNFISEMERLLLVIWLIFFGGSLANGVLDIMNWKAIVFALILILVIRPITGMISMIGSPQNWKRRLAVSFLGIRGIGSIFYLSWAFLQVDYFVPEKALLYSISSYVILFSIIIHGLTAPRVINYFSKDE